MKYLDILDCDITDGEGIRVTLFVSGCSHHCNGCHSPFSWNPENGKEFTQEAKEKLFKLIEKPYIDGLTLSGGDPLFCSNISEIKKLCIEYSGLEKKNKLYRIYFYLKNRIKRDNNNIWLY